jgi:mannose/fructose-specific phosphotransferase system component IIA
VEHRAVNRLGVSLEAQNAQGATERRVDMIGVIVVTHLDFATNLVTAAERVMGKQRNILGLNLHRNAFVEDMVRSINSGIRECSNNPEDPVQGILILTDLFGSTPTNASLKQLQIEKMDLEVVTGVNLAMVISALNYRTRMDVKELAEKVISDGQKGIRNARCAVQ